MTHDIATKTTVHTIHRFGLYAVHRAEGDLLGEPDVYVVSHLPSGQLLGKAPTRDAAVRCTQHMHEHAGDAGKSFPFGIRNPTGPEADRIRAAMDAWTG